jgi:pimeloyl-ACP methyl ester carboxylesterase
MRVPALRRLPVAYGWLAKHGIDDAVADGWVRPAAQDPAIRRDVGAVLRGLDPRHTQEAARKLASFEKPVLLAWSREDRFFPPDHAERLARAIPRARLEWIDDAWTFSPEDQPERVATLIADFAARRIAAVG